MMVVVAVIVTARPLGRVRKRPDVVFAIATCSDILEPVRFHILTLKHLTKVLSTIMNLASLVDANVLGTSRPAADRSG